MGTIKKTAHVLVWRLMGSNRKKKSLIADYLFEKHHRSCQHMLVVCSNMLIDTELQMTGRVDDGPQGEGLHFFMEEESQ